MNSTKRIRVLVVDDAPLMRELLTDALKAQPDIEIVAAASSGQQALDVLQRLEPDLITLDLEMPGMSGLETLDEILKLRPTPVIVVSSLAQRTAEITIAALDRGAMDYVAKPEGLDEAARVFRSELPAKIRNMAGADVARILQFRKARQLRQKVAERARKVTAGADLPTLNRACIAIGVSTGGPPALASLFSSLEPPLPPIVIVQHMPQLFTAPFAKRLDSLSSIEVREAVHGDELRPNTALVAPGGKHLRLKRVDESVRVEIFEAELVSGHKPSVDVLMQSAAEIYGEKCLGLIMTGMGRDGANGCKSIRKNGGYVLGQDEATSDVYGMNKVALTEGGVDEQVPLGEIAANLTAHARRILGGLKPTTSRIPSSQSVESQIESTLNARPMNAKTPDTENSSSKAASGYKFNLCVVDDDPAQLRLLVHRLKNVLPDQLNLYGTSSPQEAMERIEARAVDILIADLVMPNLTGVDLLRELKRRNTCTQALIMTATADIESLLTAFELGAVDYLLKPIDPAQVERLVQEAAQRLSRWRVALAGAFRRTRQGAVAAKV
jgi:two-component system chemotaxis response regulator CheB